MKIDASIVLDAKYDQCLPHIELGGGGGGGLCLAGCHVVAQTQGYHLVCLWGSLVKLQGVGLF